MNEHGHTHTVRERRRTVDRRVVSPGQIIAGAIGLFLLIFGGVALARVGLSSLTGETNTVLGFDHTALMGLIDIVGGLLFLGAASSPAMKGSMIGLGLMTLAFGAIVAIEPAAFDTALGGGRDLGLLYVIIGIVGLLAALAFPTITVDRVATEEDGSTSKV